MVVEIAVANVFRNIADFEIEADFKKWEKKFDSATR
jgi:hypothetical protein